MNAISLLKFYANLPLMNYIHGGDKTELNQKKQACITIEDNDKAHLILLIYIKCTMTKLIYRVQPGTFYETH